MVDTNWRAVLSGFVVALVIGLLSGATVAGETLPAVGYGLAGILAGLVAGYMAGGTIGNGAYNGGLATVIGGLVALVVLAVTGVLFAGLVATVAILVTGLLFLVIYAIPGAVGGAIGALVKGRRAGREMAEPAA